jgi:DNA-binding NarL/FixJ family response regulator
MTIRVLLVDDQALLRLGFRMVLEAQDDISIVGEAEDGAGAIAMANSLRPDVVLMDVRMPGIDGIDATESIVQAGLDTKVLILTTFDMDEYVYAGLRAGASGFLLKDVLPAELISALRAVAAGDAVIAPSATRRLLLACTPMLPTPQRGQQREQILQALTEREREVFPMVAAALTNREISLRLHVSESTVKVHVSRILAKLQLRDRVQIVVLAYESGLVVPTS